MISVNFCLSTPWSKRWQNVWSRSYKTPFENKFLELEVFKDNSIVSFMFNWTLRQSHGGLNVELGLLGHSVNFNFYDSRHWSYDLDRYYNYGEE